METMKISSKLTITNFADIFRPFAGEFKKTEEDFAFEFFNTFISIDNLSSKDAREVLSKPNDTLKDYIKNTPRKPLSYVFACAAIGALDKKRASRTIGKYPEEKRRYIFKKLSKYCTGLDFDKLPNQCADIFEELMDRYAHDYYKHLAKNPIPDDILLDIPSGDLALVNEVDMICPVCGKTGFIQKHGNKDTLSYRVVDVVPSDLDKNEIKRLKSKLIYPLDYDSKYRNKIAVCNGCANDQEFLRTDDVIEKMIDAKNYALKSYTVMQTLDETRINNQLKSLITMLYADDQEYDFSSIDLNYTAHKVSEKIIPGPGSQALSMKIIASSATYIEKIQKWFSELDDYNERQSEDIQKSFRRRYEDFESAGMSQLDIYNSIVDWVMKKFNLRSDYSATVEIIVAYFVQDCEVFKVNEVS